LQVERLEWLLEKVQQDYAYFDSLQRRFEQDMNGHNNNNGSSNGGYGGSSSSGSHGYRW